MNKKNLNTFWLGTLGGLLLPFLSIFCYWLYSYKFMHFFPQFFDFLLLGKVLSAVLSLCLIPNLGLFFLFINQEYYKTSYGIILATFLYGFTIVVLKTWVEHSWSA
ncbi:MAG: hypothetical protein JST67_00430 [Bacteroidetes bacterium]|nr:hypothetical protein [Bacteroidota bacterium]